MAFFHKAEKLPPPPRLKRIIDGVIYDSGKAECIASHIKRRSAGPYRYFSHEMLHRSNQGNWFFVLGQRLSADQQPDIFVQPISPEQAYAWLCEFHEIELLERYFPEKVRYA